MNPSEMKSYIQAIVDGLTPLVEKLNHGGEYLFRAAMRANYATAIAEGIRIVLAVALAVVTWRVVKYGLAPVKDTLHTSHFDESDGGLCIVAVVLISTAIISLIGACVVGPDMIHRLVAPEWSTIQDIVSTLHPK